MNEIDISEVYPWIPLIGSIIVACVLFLSFTLNKRALDDDKKSRYAQLLRDLDHDISDQEDKIHHLKTSDEVIDYAIGYVNVLERISFLHLTNRLPAKDIPQFFQTNFEDGLTLKNWIDKIEPEKEEISIDVEESYEDENK